MLVVWGPKLNACPSHWANYTLSQLMFDKEFEYYDELVGPVQVIPPHYRYDQTQYTHDSVELTCPHPPTFGTGELLEVVVCATTPLIRSPNVLTKAKSLTISSIEEEDKC